MLIGLKVASAWWVRDSEMPCFLIKRPYSQPQHRKNGRSCIDKQFTMCEKKEDRSLLCFVLNLLTHSIWSHGKGPNRGYSYRFCDEYSAIGYLIDIWGGRNVFFCAIWSFSG